MSSQIDTLIKETKAAFIIAKSDGILDASEVIQIAVDLAKKIQALASLSGSEKKALLLHTLKKGLDTSGGLDSLPAFANSSNEAKTAFEDEILKAASKTIDVIFDAVNGKIDFRKPANWKFCLPLCISAANVMIPNDQNVLKDAVKYADILLKKEENTTISVIDEVVKVSDVVA